jgi:hypothetical protein
MSRGRRYADNLGRVCERRHDGREEGREGRLALALVVVSFGWSSYEWLGLFRCSCRVRYDLGQLVSIT